MISRYEGDGWVKMLSDAFWVMVGVGLGLGAILMVTM